MAITPESGPSPGEVTALIDRLHARLTDLGSVVVAFSGGVDSSLVAALAHRALGDGALAVTGVSPALAAGELDGARDVAASIGISHLVIGTDELARPGYRANGPDRCYHCKSELYDALAELATERGFAALASGANAEDLGDWRPGLIAAREHAVVHPLVEAGLDKVHVRALARRLELPSAAKVASPCLASRIPHGTPVDPQALACIDAAESAVRALGFRVLRIRHHGDLGKLELAEDELERALEPTWRAAIVEAVRSAGYRRVAIDLEPFTSGTLTAGLRARGLSVIGADRTVGACAHSAQLCANVASWITGR